MANTDAPKLPYFHRTLSAEDDALLRASSRPTKLDDDAHEGGSHASKAGSAWNAAGSWEERDVTAQSLLLFQSVMSSPFNGVDYTVDGCEGLEGTASLVFSKGKVRFLFDMSFRVRVEFSVESSAKLVGAASIVVNDLSNDQPSEDYDLDVKWGPGASPPGPQLQAAKSRLLGGATRAALSAKVAAFEAAFRAAHVPL